MKRAAVSGRSFILKLFLRRERPATRLTQSMASVGRKDRRCHRVARISVMRKEEKTPHACTYETVLPRSLPEKWMDGRSQFSPPITTTQSSQFIIPCLNHPLTHPTSPSLDTFIYAPIPPFFVASCCRSFDRSRCFLCCFFFLSLSLLFPVFRLISQTTVHDDSIGSGQWPEKLSFSINL